MPKKGKQRAVEKGIGREQALRDWTELSAKLSRQTWGRTMREAADYWVDFSQRWVMYMDTLRQRGNNMIEHYRAGLPPLLDYEYDEILDASTFERPANYKLLRIRDPEGRKPASDRRPLVIIDPRAGHGPGIGGFKKDSEVGMGLTEGHPVYFVAFTPEPCPGQTLEDVELALVRFLEEVRGRHMDRDLPIVYGNCQAGWLVAMLGADRPDVTGPIVINGAPLSYWAGAEGVNPMRLAGGLMGGTWLTRLMCDLDGGVFDGAYLVSNFENLNPANTLWMKQYQLFADVDGERERFLDFERWWTGFFLLNEEEILWIVNNLFVGDKLEQGQLQIGPGHRIDLTKLDDPLVIFASSGDNISPPQQALHWISEMYRTTADLKKAGQRIVYLLNPHIGHLGIFVSAGVARREHRAIIEHIERIRALSPGLYEMFIEGETGEPDPLKDQFVVRFEERDVADVSFPIDRDEFERMAAVSRANENFYLAFGRPIVRTMAHLMGPASVRRWLRPARLSRVLYSDRINPLMKVFEPLARVAGEHRKPTGEGNTFRYTERRVSDNMVTFLSALGRQRDAMYETLFELMYRE